MKKKILEKNYIKTNTIIFFNLKFLQLKKKNFINILILIC